MQGFINFELINKEDDSIWDSSFVKNTIMDNTYRYLAGDNIMGGDYQIGLGTVFLDDETEKGLSNLRNRIFLSSSTPPTQSGTNTFFTCETFIQPNQANGDIIEVGLFKGGLLYNRAILKRQGQLPSGTSYTYKVVSALGSQRSSPSSIISGTTSSGTNNYSVKLKWDTNLVSDNYFIYRSSDGVNYKLLSSTNKNYYFDDGFTAISNSNIPAPNGTVPTVNTYPGIVTTDPVPYSASKTSEFAARVKVIIMF